MLLKLDYSQACDADKKSVDAEGALIAPAAATVEELWLAALDLVFLPNAEIMSDNSGLPGTRRPAEQLCPWREVRDLSRPPIEFHILISKFHSRSVKCCVESQSY